MADTNSGAFAIKMNEAYFLVESIWKRYLSGVEVDVEREILGLLLRQGIRIRQQDGELMQINLSVPTSTQDTFVIGLRYLKKDKTYTEDHFLSLDSLCPR